MPTIACDDKFGNTSPIGYFVFFGAGNTLPTMRIEDAYEEPAGVGLCASLITNSKSKYSDFTRPLTGQYGYILLPDTLTYNPVEIIGEPTLGLSYAYTRFLVCKPFLASNHGEILSAIYQRAHSDIKGLAISILRNNARRR